MTETIFEIIVDSLRNAVLISGLVVVMMMLIELLNIDSQGDFFKGLRSSRTGQVVLSALLGAVPGCMGGFASVSLYTHGIFSFGALVAMMIASSGDEAFVMLAMMPEDAVWIFVLLIGIAVAAGLLTDLAMKSRVPGSLCKVPYSVHTEDDKTTEKKGRHLSWKRALMFVGLALFIAALVTGQLEHEHNAENIAGHVHGKMNFLSEEWMYWMFGVLGLIVLVVLVRGSDHFVEEHLWHHIVCRHLPAVFLWTFGVLVFLGISLQYLDIESWISSNTAIMILLAALVGIIPESGPHLIFVTLYASGIVPLPVLLASCISQDGHASLPLLAESKKSFLLAKLLNFTVAIVAGFVALAFIH